MFGIKTKLLYPQFLFTKNSDKFPQRPISRLRIKARIFGLINKLKDQKKMTGIGHLVTFPHQAAIDIWKKLLPYNPNNLGNWSIKGTEPTQETTLIERQLIAQMVDLYQSDKDQIEGYVTSGATEGNIFSAWVGRNFLHSKGVNEEQIILIKTSLTHYSIEKAADIIGIAVTVTPLNGDDWNMDTEGFEETIRGLVGKGFRGFLVPLTLGYTVTGTTDSYREICEKTDILEKELKVKFFIWMDAALNGLIEPFLDNKFRPFEHRQMKTFLTDFHKFGSVPLPAGVILYRKRLRQLIEKPIDYLSEKDNTLLGSRSGIAPVACWTMVNSFGKKLFAKKIEKCLRGKNKFISDVEGNQSVRLINVPTSLTCGLVQVDLKADLSELENKYNLKFRKNRYMFVGGTKILNVAKVHFIETSNRT